MQPREYSRWYYTRVVGWRRAATLVGGTDGSNHCVTHLKLTCHGGPTILRKTKQNSRPRKETLDCCYHFSHSIDEETCPKSRRFGAAEAGTPGRVPPALTHVRPSFAPHGPPPEWQGTSSLCVPTVATERGQESFVLFAADSTAFFPFGIEANLEINIQIENKALILASNVLTSFLQRHKVHDLGDCSTPQLQ